MDGDHPRDVWVDVACFGDEGPQMLLAVDGRELEILEARELYAHDRITLEELNDRVARNLGLPLIPSPPDGQHTES